MRNLVRGLVGAVGLLGLFLALAFWIHPAQAAAKFGLETIGSLGLASVRADMGGMFGAVGVLSLLGAVRNRGDLLLAPTIIIALALAARIFSLVMTGLSQDLLPPMIVEVVLLTILILGRRVLPRPLA